MQLRVLSPGLLQAGDVRIGVFPKVEKIVVGGERPDASGIGVPKRARLWTATRWLEPLPDAPRLPSSSSRRCCCGRESFETRRQHCPVRLRGAERRLTECNRPVSKVVGANCAAVKPQVEEIDVGISAAVITVTVCD
jgi:hypothetical protein